MNFENIPEYVNWEDEIPVIQYKSLTDTGCVEHGFSTRLGGVSQGIYKSMNLSYTRGDDKGAVDENFRRFCDRLHMDWQKIVSTDQTHTANVRIVTEADEGHGISRPKSFFDVDGQVTDVPGLPLITYHADCVPLFFVDPVKKAIGLTHSGWRGTAARIGRNTVETMQKPTVPDRRISLLLSGLLCARIATKSVKMWPGPLWKGSGFRTGWFMPKAAENIS